MRRILFVLLMLTGPAWAQSAVSAEDEEAIRGVITQQLEAFGRDDASAAYAFASPHIQEKFADPARFLDMVRRAYPAVHRPRSFDFSELLVGDSTIVQQVELIGPDNEPKLALYSMEREPSGQWRIDGCILVRSTRTGS